MPLRDVHVNSMIQSSDPITFEIISHRLHQVTREMGTTLERVGGTVNTTQLHDYMASLYRANGDLISAGDSMGWHVVCAGYAVKRIIERFGKDDGIWPDDMFLLNDPYLAAIHQSDLYLISPIHHKGQLVAWSATFVHVMDIGAMSPGGNSPGATEICQEGVRVPGVKLVEGGRLRRDVFDMIVGMTRQPVMVGLDLKCEMAANNVARMRMEEMYGQYGTELVDGVSQDMIRYSESILRRRLMEIPDGIWTDNGVIQAGGRDETWKIVLTLKKKADCLVFDFRASDRQAKIGINLPYHATFGACFGAVFSTVGYDLPKNHGAFGPIEVLAAKGTVVDVEYPGPVSLNTTSGGAAVKYVANSVLMQMLSTSKKWQGEVMALNAGGRSARHAGVNQYGMYYVSVLSVGAIAGSGGRSCKDGIDSGGGSLSCSNVEWMEMNFPLLHLFRRHVKDGAGAGKFRGGEGAETALTLHDAPDKRIKGVAMGAAGMKNSGEGIFGGHPAARSVIALLKDTLVWDFIEANRLPEDLHGLGGQMRQLPYCDFDFGKNDVLYIRAASGGGYGDPLERDGKMVVRDVVNGVVSKEAARGIYGVALDRRGELNGRATEKLRAKMRRERLKGAFSGKAFEGERNDGQASYAPCEVVEVWEGGGRKQVRCARCRAKLGELGRNWRENCQVKWLRPTEAGPLMKDLVGHYLLQQFYCPSCGALLQNDLVEKNGKRSEKDRIKPELRRTAPKGANKRSG